MVSIEEGHAGSALADILAALRNAAAEPFETARPMPGSVNHSPVFHAHERDRVFMREWICVGRDDEIPGTGDYLTHDVANVPVLIARQKDGSVAAMVNACAHRRARLISDRRGTVRRFACPYHAWSYDLCGSLLRAPFMEMKPDFNRADHGLRRIHAETWEGFIYVNLSDKPAKTVAAALQPLKENVVGRFDMSAYRTVLRDTITWDANWKNLIENFTESYHVPIAHPATFAQHKKPLTNYVCGEDSDHYCYHHAAKSADNGGGTAHPTNTRLLDDWRRMMVDFCVFPSHLITLMPDFLWWVSVQPDGVDHFRADWGVAIPPEFLADISADEYDNWLADIRAYMDTANSEDKVLVEALHKGSASPLLPPGTYHPIERNNWQFMRYISRLCAGNGEEPKD